MAKTTLHPLLWNLWGVLGLRDISVGRMPALGLTIQQAKGGPIIGIKQKKPEKASPLQQAQRDLWRSADCTFKELCPSHLTILDHQRIIYNLTNTPAILTAYHYYMHLQLIGRPPDNTPWTDGFNGLYYDSITVQPWTDGFNGPNWDLNWVTEWYEGFNL